MRRLAERADVLVENFRPGVMENWGLGPQVHAGPAFPLHAGVQPSQDCSRLYLLVAFCACSREDGGMQGQFGLAVCERVGRCMQDLNRDLIYTRISGYGQTGPKASLPGYASVCEAYGGFRWTPKAVINACPERCMLPRYTSGVLGSMAFSSTRSISGDLCALLSPPSQRLRGLPSAGT